MKILKVWESNIDLCVGLLEGVYSVRNRIEWVNMVDSCLERVITDIKTIHVAYKDKNNEVQFDTYLHFNDGVKFKFEPYENTEETDRLIDYLLTCKC